MKQSEKTAITKQKILTAAENEFSQNGFAAARVDNIAKEACVNKQMIYAHFDNKENLYATVLKIVYSRLEEYETPISQMDFDGVETIRKVILGYFNFLMQNPSFVRLVLWENLNDAKYASRIETDIFSGVKLLLKKGIELNTIRPDLDIDQTIMSMNMFCFSAFSNTKTLSKLLHKDYYTTEELTKRANHIADVLIKYIF